MDGTWRYDEASTEMRGTVRWYCPMKGYGFVSDAESGYDVLLHHNVLLLLGRASISEGCQVTYQMEHGKKGRRVTKILSLEIPDYDKETAIDRAANLNKAAVRVSWFDQNKGFGFVNELGSSEDIFIHINALRKCGLMAPQPGEALCATIGDGHQGKTVVSVHAWNEISPSSCSS